MVDDTVQEQTRRLAVVRGNLVQVEMNLTIRERHFMMLFLNVCYWCLLYLHLWLFYSGWYLVRVVTLGGVFTYLWSGQQNQDPNLQ